MSALHRRRACHDTHVLVRGHRSVSWFHHSPGRRVSSRCSRAARPACRERGSCRFPARRRDAISSDSDVFSSEEYRKAFVIELFISKKSSSTSKAKVRARAHPGSQARLGHQAAAEASICCCRRKGAGRCANRPSAWGTRERALHVRRPPGAAAAMLRSSEVLQHPRDWGGNSPARPSALDEPGCDDGVCSRRDVGASKEMRPENAKSPQTVCWRVSRRRWSQEGDDLPAADRSMRAALPPPIAAPQRADLNMGGFQAGGGPWRGTPR